LIVTTTGAGLCGGSVISATAVLTAAHCTSAQAVGYTIIAGAYNRLVIESNQQRWTNLPLSAFIPHPQYGPLLLRNDVAVVRNDAAPFTFNQFVQPIILASDDSDRHVGVLATVSGNT
jgi:secreted trypsin-like serine protease